MLIAGCIISNALLWIFNFSNTSRYILYFWIFQVPLEMSMIPKWSVFLAKHLRWTFWWRPKSRPTSLSMSKVKTGKDSRYVTFLFLFGKTGLKRASMVSECPRFRKSMAFEVQILYGLFQVICYLEHVISNASSWASFPVC